MIKNVVFDFGNVLMPISIDKTWNALQKLGGTKELQEQAPIFNAYEKGEITSKEFLTQIQPFFFRKIFLGDLGDAWNAIIDTVIPEESIETLKRTKKDYRIFLLSNTNALHIKAVKECSGPFTYKQFLTQFEKHYYSYEVGQRKPDSEIFETVLKENDLKAEETLYIDDSSEHIESAKTLGLETWCFDPKMDKITDLDKVLSKLHS